MEMEEIKTLLDEQGEALQSFIATETKEREELEARINRGALNGATQSETKTMSAISDVLRKAAVVSTATDVTAQLAEAAAETKATSASVGVDPSGGFAVISDFEARVRTVARDQGAMRRVANVRTISSDSFEYLLNNGSEAEASWTGEKSTRSDTESPELKKGKIEANEIYALPKATSKLVEDSAIDIASWLASEVGMTFGEKEAEAFILGDGILKPRGITTFETEATPDASRDYGKFGHVLSGANGAFASSNPGDKLIDLVHALHPGYRRNARFIMSSETAGTVRKFKDGMGNYLWQRSLTEGQPDMLCGYPVEMDEFMPGLSSGSLSVAFGDWQRCYQIVDRQGIKVLVDPYTSKPFIKFYTTSRVGGDVVDFRAAKFLKFSAS